MMKHSEINWARLIDLAHKLLGKKYVFGAEVNLKDPNPDNIRAIDCSELVEWLYAQIGITVPDGSYNQAKICNELRGWPSEFPSKLIIGDLGFKWNPDNHVIHHVGIYVGEGNLIEAKGIRWGVVKTAVNSYMSSSHFAFWGRLRQIENA